MSKNNNDFFKEKKAWSEVKDELLGCYLKPYMQKIFHTHKPVIYIDCFAGKGKFEDGKDGSPLIALNTIEACKQQTRMEQTDISTFFIDLNYAEDLNLNLSTYKNVNIISGKFEENIERILENKNHCNVFLYIDPYGIKALQYGLFEKFAQSFNSIELLINLNSFGFVREGCHALGINYEVDPYLFDDLIEYSPTQLNRSEKSVKQLTEIAGGDYWIKIIEDYKRKLYNGYDAEKKFAEQYCNQLMESYKYVLNMPLRIKQGQQPKYRMVHATNHEEGCILMVDNMYNRWQALQELQNNCQMSLFDEDAENNIINDNILNDFLLKHLSSYKQFTSVNTFLAEFFVKHGAISSRGDITKLLKKLELQGMLEADRVPSKTLKGKNTTFFSVNSKQKVSIRSKI